MFSENKIKITQSSENIFNDLGFSEEEAANLKIRAELMLDLRQYIEEKGWTQQEAAKFLGETQPRISNLMRGEISRFSVDKLINILGKVGMDVKIEVVSKVA